MRSAWAATSPGVPSLLASAAASSSIVGRRPPQQVRQPAGRLPGRSGAAVHCRAGRPRSIRYMNCGDSSSTWITDCTPVGEAAGRSRLAVCPCPRRTPASGWSRSAVSSGRRQARLPKPSRKRSRQVASPSRAGSQASSAGSRVTAAAASFSAADTQRPASRSDTDRDSALLRKPSACSSSGRSRSAGAGDAEQVADGVQVFGPGQPAQRRGPGIGVAGRSDRRKGAGWWTAFRWTGHRPASRDRMGRCHRRGSRQARRRPWSRARPGDHLFRDLAGAAPQRHQQHQPGRGWSRQT